MTRESKIHVCWTLYTNKISPEQIPKEIGVHRATVYRWIKGIQQYGLALFVERYLHAKQGKRRRKETSPITKERIYAIREQYHQCCGEKIQYFYEQEYGSKISLSTIYRILGQKYQLRSKWKKNVVRGKVLKGTKPREVIQVDTVDLGNVYAFTAIDTYTKEASVILKTKLDAQSGREALEQQLEYFGTIERIQRDGGPEFKNEWQTKAYEVIPVVRTARPYKKNEQAFIERFNGILRKECVGYLKYRQQDMPDLLKKIQDYLYYYHYIRPHLSLNLLTPHQFAMSHLT